MDLLSSETLLPKTRSRDRYFDSSYSNADELKFDDPTASKHVQFSNPDFDNFVINPNCRLHPKYSKRKHRRYKKLFDQNTKADKYSSSKKDDPVYLGNVIEKLKQVDQNDDRKFKKVLKKSLIPDLIQGYAHSVIKRRLLKAFPERDPSMISKTLKRAYKKFYRNQLSE
ncbi:BVpp26-like-1 protein [Chelonus insularis]|nr:BVpp26-like-1 protein [Chelonus insularis]